MSDIVWGIIGIALLVFLFKGEPNAIHQLHEYVMNMPACQKYK